MFPSDKQLIKQLLKTAHELLPQIERADHKASLGAMEVIINELLLRSDKAFYLDYYADGCRLLEEARALSGIHINDATQRDIDRLPRDLAANVDADTLRDGTLALSRLLETLVKAIDPGGDEKSVSLLKRIGAWDIKLLAQRLQPAKASAADPVAGVSIDQQKLEHYLRQAKPDWADLKVISFSKVPGGFSKCTILFETEDRVNGRQQLAIRAEQPIHLLELDGSNIANEYPLVAKAFASGIPTAEPLWLETDRQHFNSRFLVSRKASGINFGTATGASTKLRPEAVRSLAEVMANIHRIPMKRGDAWIEQSHFGKWLDHGNTRQNTLARIAEWEKQSRDAELFPSPQIARAIRWLSANVPEFEGPPVFLHGDYGPHNILLDGDRVSAVLDWEIATPGDSAYDVCWFLNCTAGVVEPAQFIDCYLAAGGLPISEYRLRYFEAFASMFMPITCVAALKLIEDEDQANVNLAYYGLRFAHEYASRMEKAIERAEAVRHLQ